MPCGKIGFGLANLWAIGEKLGHEHEALLDNSVDQIHCPECDWKITTGYSWCPKCGLRLIPYFCDYCKGVVPQNVQECPRCGAPVN